MAFQRNQSQRSFRAGLPHRHHPFPGFLTLSTVLSRRNLVALFRATSAHRLSTFRAFSTRVSRGASRHPLLSCHQVAVTAGEPAIDTLGAPSVRGEPRNTRYGERCHPGFRALLRPGVRAPRVMGKHPTRPLLSWPSSSPRLTRLTVGRSLPSCTWLIRCGQRTSRWHFEFTGATGSQSSRTCAELPRESR